MTTPAVSIPVSLTHYYRMDTLEPVQNAANPGVDTLTDVSTGVQTLVIGAIDNAIDLVGPDSILSAVAAGDWAVPPAVAGEFAFTVGVWVNITTFSGQPFGFASQIIVGEAIDSTEAGTVFQLGVTTTTRIPYFLCTQSDTTTIRVTASAALVPGTWYFIAGWVDGATNEIGILNQATVVTAAHDGTLLDAGATTRFIGRKAFSVTGNMQGIIDEVDIWSRRLSLDELDFIENDGAGLSDLQNIPNPAVPTDSTTVAYVLSPFMPVVTLTTAADIADMVTDILSRLNDDGTLFTRAEILRWISEGYRRFTNQTQPARTFTALDMPPRHTRAITHPWESNDTIGSGDGFSGTYRKWTFTHQNGRSECTFLWEAQAADNIPVTPQLRAVSQLWELSLGEGDIDAHYRFALPRNEAVIHGVWHDHDRLEATTTQILDGLEDKWWTVQGEPTVYAQTLGDANTFDVYEIETEYQQAYEHREASRGSPRGFSGDRTYVINSGLTSWGYAYAWNGEPQTPSVQLTGPGRRFTLGPVSDVTFNQGDGFFYTHTWEGQVHAGETPTASSAIAETNPIRYDPAVDPPVQSTIDIELGIYRKGLSPDRQYFPSAQWQVQGIARRWGSSKDNILVWHSVNATDILSEADTLPLIPPRVRKYLAFFALSILFNRQGEGYDPALAGHYQQRASRGVVLLHKLANVTRTNAMYTREVGPHSPRVRNRLPQLPSNFARASWLRR